MKPVFSIALFLTALLQWPDTRRAIAFGGKNDDRILRFHLTRSDGIYSIDIKSRRDSIVGRHCFTYDGGDKIDCCLDKNSLFLKKFSKNIYRGTMTSCYDDKIYNVEICLFQDSLKFKIKDSTHIFLDKADSLVLRK